MPHLIFRTKTVHMTVDFVLKTAGARKKWQNNLEYWRKRTFTQKSHAYKVKLYFLSEGEMKALFVERKSFCYKQTYQSTTAKSCSLNKQWRRKWENLGHQEEKEKKASKIIINTIVPLSSEFCKRCSLVATWTLSYLYLVRPSFPYLSGVTQTPPRTLSISSRCCYPFPHHWAQSWGHEKRIPREVPSPLEIKGRLLIDSTFQRNYVVPSTFIPFGEQILNMFTN